MFTNLIESESHQKEFKRRSSFFLATVAIYALILFSAGVASIYAYDVRLDALNDDLVVLNWVPPVERAIPDKPRNTEPPRRSTRTNAKVDPSVRRPERTDFIARADDPARIPTSIGVQAPTTLPYSPGAVHGNQNVDPNPIGPSNSNACVTCNGTDGGVRVVDPIPPPTPVSMPTTQRVTSQVLTSKALSLPQPLYPI